MRPWRLPLGFTNCDFSHLFPVLLLAFRRGKTDRANESLEGDFPIRERCPHLIARIELTGVFKIMADSR